MFICVHLWLKNGRFPLNFSTYSTQKRPFFPQLPNVQHPKTAVSPPKICCTRKDTDEHGHFFRVIPRPSVSKNGRFSPQPLNVQHPKTAVFSQLSYRTRTNTDERGQTAVSPLNFSTCNAQKRPFSPNFSTVNTPKRPFFFNSLMGSGQTWTNTDISLHVLLYSSIAYFGFANRFRKNASLFSI